MVCRPKNTEPAPRQRGVETEGAVWQKIRDEASALAAREPALRTLLSPLIDVPSGAVMLVRVLAARLAVSAAEREVIAALLSETLDGDMLAATEADLAAVVERDPACPGAAHVLSNLKGFQALQTYRFAHRLWQSGRTEAARWLASQAALVFGLDIHPGARIGRGVMLDHGSGIVIGETTVIEDDVSILQNVTLGGTGKQTGDRHPKIRRGVMIGAGAKILGNIEIGAFSKVAAGSVVLRPVPAHTTVAGVPATVVRIHAASERPAAEMNQNIL
ncbi:serine O-acetyltransferase [Rhizobium sp. TRM95111]|uniref:serine O-acetyltransferase n=1 Tax=Rhizobium alarense TaxID=2846851 RepID=UPI001F420A7C|nr:serine O-acetyltransferase [Rhizobium alarense]MCF3642259.1 serine O-acetyltransferase [Rhizobium alarense]